LRLRKTRLRLQSTGPPSERIAYFPLPCTLWNAHKARCDAVQRRGVQLRLQAAISNMVSFGEANLYDVELDTLKVARSELVKVEDEMRAAEQKP